MGNWKITAKIVLIRLREHWFAVAMGLALLGALAAMTARQGSPMVACSLVAGEILSFQSTSFDPAEGVGRGFRYRYAVRLAEGGPVVFASDYLLHAIGSKMTLARLQRQDGSLRYRFAPPGGTGGC